MQHGRINKHFKVTKISDFPHADPNYPFEIRLMKLLHCHRKFSIVLQIVLVLFNVYGLVWSTKERYNDSRQPWKDNHVIMFTTSLSDLMMMAVTIITIIAVTHTTYLVEAITAMNYSNLPSVDDPKNKIFLIYLNVFRVLPLIPLLASACFSGYTMGWEMYRYFLPRDIWYLLLHWVVCSGVRLYHRITSHFKAINDHLKNFDQVSYLSAIKNYVQAPKLIIDHTHQLRIKLYKIRIYSKEFNDLCNFLDAFNLRTKIVLVTVLVCIAVNILNNISIIIEFTIKPKVINENNNISMLIICIQSIILCLSVGQVALLAFAGEKLEEEGRRTIQTCYVLLNKSDRFKPGEGDVMIMQEIHFLLDHSRSRKICIHAGSFFTLNWGILGSMVSTITTYAIVIIQFLLK